MQAAANRMAINPWFILQKIKGIEARRSLLLDAVPPPESEETRKSLHKSNYLMIPSDNV